MLRWLMALMASSFTFALADVLCDVCITESEADEQAQTIETAADDDELSEQGSGIEMCSQTSHDDSPQSRRRYQVDSLETPEPARYKALGEQSGAGHHDHDDHEAGLSGAQDAAIAGLVTIVGLIGSVLYYVLLSKPASDALAAAGKAGGGISLKWWPTTHFQWWLAILGGASIFFHYFLLLKAFEGAPSTVLLPLVQVASVSVLLGSSVVALYRHEPWITTDHH